MGKAALLLPVQHRVTIIIALLSESDCCADFNKMSSRSDPLGLYSGLGCNVDISSITINKPEVRNCNGALIHPREYRTVLKDRAFVGVQVYFKM